MSRPVFVSPDLGDDEVLLAGPEGRHAAVVKRIRIGEQLDLVDGRGTRATGTVSATGKDTVTIRIDVRVVEPEPSPRITVVQAVAKGDRGELAVELCTEVGVDAVVPWQSARCVAKWSDKTLARWTSTAVEASKQARRARFLDVSDVATTAQVAALPGRLLVLHEEATVPLSSVELAGDVVLVVGPEGGITPEELAALGGTAVRLGQTVLRTSTAGAAAASVVSARLGRW